LFFGTPHKGSDLAGYLSIVERLAAWAQLKHSSSTNLTDELRLFSNSVLDINQSFKGPSANLEIVDFFETKETRLPSGSALVSNL
jgi:hypothetical protein